MSADASQLRYALQRWQRLVFDDAAHELLTGPETVVPVATGATVAAGNVGDVSESQGFVSGVLAFPTPQALFTNDGTRPHRIEGNPLLSFYWPKIGRRVTVRYVNHPGNKATHWFDEAMKDQRWGDLLERAMGRMPLGS